jgi:flagellar M-ring protein FliF
MVDLYSGRALGEEQVAAIVHLVSSSVPHLEPEKVTIVDQRGNLLSNGAGSDDMAQSSSQFSYNRKLEMTYTDRIRNLLEPIVGAGRIRATVNANLDFTVTERTQESYNPDLPSLRSEQISEDISRDSSGPSGIPGALSNQPPEETTLQDSNALPGGAWTRPSVIPGWRPAVSAVCRLRWLSITNRCSTKTTS